MTSLEIETEESPHGSLFGGFPETAAIFLRFQQCQQLVPSLESLGRMYFIFIFELSCGTDFFRCIRVKSFYIIAHSLPFGFNMDLDGCYYWSVIGWKLKASVDYTIH